MKNTYAALIAVGTGLLGLVIGAVGAGAIVGIGATAGGAISGSILGICMTTDAAIMGGLIQEKQLDQLAISLAQEVNKTLPQLTSALKASDYQSQLQKIDQGGQPTANCDRLIQGALTQLNQSQ
ncbi:MAG: hypothetical protein GC158_16640 [Cyanobacteria bacterium RI_101]|nr:hypothetical protein [Cyanobacteria bacterium RI_101]